LSTLQFSFSLSMKRRRRENCDGMSNVAKFFYIVFVTETWALLVKFFFQDFIFLLIRLDILVRHEATTQNYTLYFFVAKNLILCVFEMYRCCVLFFDEISRMRQGVTYVSELNETTSGIYMF
jgi:hypothetical protein